MVNMKLKRMLFLKLKRMLFLGVFGTCVLQGVGQKGEITLAQMSAQIMAAARAAARMEEFTEAQVEEMLAQIAATTKHEGKPTGKQWLQ